MDGICTVRSGVFVPCRGEEVWIRASLTMMIVVVGGTLVVFGVR